MLAGLGQVFSDPFWTSDERTNGISNIVAYATGNVFTRIGYFQRPMLQGSFTPDAVRFIDFHVSKTPECVRRELAQRFEYRVNGWPFCQLARAWVALIASVPSPR